MFAGVIIGASSVNRLHAQAKPGGYVVIDISEMTNPDLFKTLLPKAPAAMQAFGGQFVMGTEKITALDGVPPKRFVVLLRQCGEGKGLERFGGAKRDQRHSRKIDEVAVVHCRCRHVTPTFDTCCTEAATDSGLSLFGLTVRRIEAVRDFVASRGLVDISRTWPLRRS
jgi:Domain of unknown function (DUF1330)